MPDWLLQVLTTAAASGLVVWGVIRTELKYLRRDVDAVAADLKVHRESPHERRIGNLKKFQAEYCK